jgi:hypothetical protein
MKYILLIAIALITVNATAQDYKREQRQGDRKESAQQLKDFSPEEIATLQSKKMALRLDLSEAQQKEVKAFNLLQAKTRKSNMEARNTMQKERKGDKPSKEERFNIANSRLDHKLATKAKMKTILNNEQYEKWQKSNAMKGRQKNMNHKKQEQQKRNQKQRN